MKNQKKLCKSRKLEKQESEQISEILSKTWKEYRMRTKISENII